MTGMKVLTILTSRPSDPTQTQYINLAFYLVWESGLWIAIRAECQINPGLGCSAVWL